MADQQYLIQPQKEFGLNQNNIVSEAQQTLGSTYKKYIDQIDQSKYKLEELKNGLSNTDPMYQSLVDAINSLNTEQLDFIEKMKFSQDMINKYMPLIIKNEVCNM